MRLDSDGLADLPSAKLVSNRLAVTASLQPRAEWLLDISGDQEAIWMGMHKHARYNVRLAERAQAEMQFYEPAKAPLDVFFRLMETTADRDNVQPPKSCLLPGSVRKRTGRQRLCSHLYYQ